MSDPEMLEHFRVADSDYPEGIYRVVGTPEASVTLLRVGDIEGQRIHTGEIVAVDRDDLVDFEPADNPDGNRSLSGTLIGIPKTIFWQLRAFAGSLAANPILATVGVALLLVGRFGEQTLGFPAGLDAAFIVAGAFVLALAGSGRL